MLRTLEKYEILEEIGHGGMATVYRARDTKLDRLVALKVMHPHLRASKEARARFRREAQGVARLHHPRVLEIYDYSGEDSEESYIAAELLTGPTLKKFADDHPSIPAEIAACFGVEVARALAAAHEKGIVHRDVKPENILLHRSEDGRWCVKLTDFGIADMVDSQSMTATGQILGSPGHMAPEQIEGRDSDPRTDVFSLGTVLYFLACGRLPFVGRNPHQVLKRIVDGDYADPLRVQPAIGGTMRAVLVKALAHAPADRHAGAAAIEADLRDFARQAGIEDAEATLGRYLADPAAVAAEVTAAAVRACTEAGRRARDAGDVPSAMDHFGRVLALDNGNAEVLALIDSVGRSERKRSLAVRAAIALAAVGAVAAGLAAFSAGPGSPDMPPAAHDPPDAGSVGAETVAEIRRAAEDAGPSSALVAALPDAGTERAAVAPRRVETGGGEPRFVRFRFDPANVSVAIDGSPPRVVGAGYPGATLPPGRHHFVVRANVPCCREAAFDALIPSGAGDFALERRLDNDDAALRIVTVPGARVRIGARDYPASEIITVPVPGPGRAVEVSYTVTAPGGASHSGNVRLAAGNTLEERVTLAAEEPPAP